MTAYPYDRERDVRQHLLKRLKVLGGELRKVSWRPRSGAPDEIVFVPARAGRRARMIWVELKRPGERPRDNQERAMRLLHDHGEAVAWVDSREAVDALLFW